MGDQDFEDPLLGHFLGEVETDGIPVRTNSVDDSLDEIPDARENINNLRVAIVEETFVFTIGVCFQMQLVITALARWAFNVQQLLDADPSQAFQLDKTIVPAVVSTIAERHFYTYWENLHEAAVHSAWQASSYVHVLWSTL